MCACLYTAIWSKCQISGDSEVPLPSGYGTFLRVDEFKAILFGGATNEGRRNETYYLDMPNQPSHQWVRVDALECFFTGCLSSAVTSHDLFFFCLHYVIHRNG